MAQLLKIRPQSVPAVVAQLTGLTVKQITSRSRHIEIVRARDMVVAIYLEHGLGWSAIGRLLKRHHTTIMGAGKRIADREVSDALWIPEMRMLRTLLAAGPSNIAKTSMH